MLGEVPKNDAQRPLDGSLLIKDKVTGCSPLPGGRQWISEQITDSGSQFIGPRDDADPANLGKPFDNLLKIRRIRSDNHRDTAGSRFNHVLSSTTRQAAANERDVPQAPAGGQFSKRV
jgi:hypothetical protein